jgi:hypothetical protein
MTKDPFNICLLLVFQPRAFLSEVRGNPVILSCCSRTPEYLPEPVLDDKVTYTFPSLAANEIFGSFVPISLGY